MEPGTARRSRPDPRPEAPRAPAAAGRPLVLGHRGASADAPENTLAAFRLALEQGADGVELDVWRCQTGEVVVIHDEDARRTAGEPLRIEATPLARLRALDAGAWKGDRFRGERLPLLAEVLEALPGAVVNIELKSRGRDPGLGAATAAVIAEAGAEGRVIVSSFDWRLVASFQRVAPGIPVGLLFEKGPPWQRRLARAMKDLAPAAVHPDVGLVTAARAAHFAARGLAMNVWTVDAPADVERLVSLRATALISNHPGLVRARVRALTGR